MGRSSSLVGHLLDVQEVVGSSPARPTIELSLFAKREPLLRERTECLELLNVRPISGIEFACLSCQNHLLPTPTLVAKRWLLQQG